MKFGQMVLGFAPWILFAVMTDRYGDNSVGFAALIAAVVAIGLAFYQRANGIKLLDAAAVVVFVVIAAIGFIGGDSVDDFLTNFSRGGTTLILAAVMLLSAFTVPFTEQYARESVPEEFWHTPRFRATNRAISLFWGGAVLVMGLGHIVAGLVDPTVDPDQGVRGVDLFFNWILPVIAIVIAVKFTKQAAEKSRAQGQAAS